MSGKLRNTFMRDNPTKRPGRLRRVSRSGFMQPTNTVLQFHFQYFTIRNQNRLVTNNTASSFVSRVYIIALISFTSSSFYSFFWTAILIGISIASFGTSFSWRVFHSVISSVYASACHPENGFGIVTSRARGMNFDCGIVIVLNLTVKVCATRNALMTEDKKRKIRRLQHCFEPTRERKLGWVNARTRFLKFKTAKIPVATLSMAIVTCSVREISRSSDFQKTGTDDLFSWTMGTWNDCETSFGGSPLESWYGCSPFSFSLLFLLVQ